LVRALLSISRATGHAAQPRDSEGLGFACGAGAREALTAVWDSGLRGEPATAEMRIHARLA